MKAFILLLFIFVSFFSVAHDFLAKAQAPIDIHDRNSLASHLVKLIETNENRKIGNHLKVYFNRNDCRVTEPELLKCQVHYLQDRWNGEMLAEFKLKNNSIIELIDLEFTGNY